MALEIYYGSSISKRTEKIYERLLKEAAAHPDRNYVMLVPEQASLTVQQELVEKAENHALLNIDVLTFNRLAYRVFRDLREPEKNVLEDSGKLMLLRLVLLRHEDQLGILKRNFRKEGFLEEMKSVISELVQYDVSPDHVLACREKVKDHPVLQKKLQDIALIYKTFLELIHRDYEMAEERMSRLAKDLGEWEELSKTTFALEGFTGFTPPQYEVLSELLHGSGGVLLGVPVGSGRNVNGNRQEEDLFYMSFRMAETMKKLAEKENILSKEYTVTEERPVGEEIRHIEKNLFVYPRQKFSKVTDAVRLQKAGSRKEEVSLLLSEILSEVRAGADFRDMAVICGSPEDYREELEDQFGAAGVPCFVDAGYKPERNPLILLLKNIFEVLDSGFSFDFTVSFMKNPLMTAYFSNRAEEDILTPYERICEVENYALALGIRGKSGYEKAFTRRTKNIVASRLSMINRTKDMLLQPLFTLETTLKNKEARTEEKLTAFVTFLEEISAGETLQKMAESFPADEILLKREYEKVYELLMALFDRMYRILGERVLSEEEFADVLLAGMAEMNLGMVPPTKDRLVVGDLKRTRLGEIRKLFILGANEGVFPKKESEGGLLSESDREALEEAEMHLAPTVRQETFFSQYYLYLMLTKPSEALTLSYVLSDDNGKALLPSYIVGMLQGMFGLTVQSAADREFSLAASEKAARNLLAEKMRGCQEDKEKPSDETRALYRWFHEKTPEDFTCQWLLRGLFYRYKEETLSAEIAKKLFHDEISGSVSRLEKFAACEFAHFLNYGLELQEREVYEVDAADIGTLLHDSIDELFRRLKEKNQSLQDLDEAARDQLVTESVKCITDQESNEVLRDNARNAYMVERLIRITKRTVWALSRHWEAGTYTETRTEEVFNALLDPDKFCLPLGDGRFLTLNGRIDRMDTAEKDDEIFVKIIDYKSGDKRTDLTEIYYGLQLQLLVYMEAARAIAEKEHPGKEIIPAGVYYYHIDDPMVDCKADEDPEDKIYKELKLRGITNVGKDAYRLTDQKVEAGASSEVVSGLALLKNGGFKKNALITDEEEMKRLGQYALDKAQTLAKEIVDGKVRVNPYSYGNSTGCSYCPYQGVCGFDRRIPGYERVKLSKKELEDFAEKEE